MYQQSPDQYVAQVIQRYAPSTSAVISYSQIEPLLVRWAGNQLSRVFISGSNAKGTAVRGGTDLDIFVSLKSSTSQDLRETYESLYQLALAQGWLPRKQNVSIGIQYLGSKIDLVPGRIQAGYQNYHSLFKNKTGTWTQTNVDLQINTIRNSQRIHEIRAIKIWRNLHNLEFPSFYLELAVIEGLEYQSTATLSQNVLKALTYTSENLTTSRIVDPGNTNNVISDDLTFPQKSAISFAAANSLKVTNWSQIIW